MKIHEVQENLKNTIKGKEAMLNGLKSTLDVRDAGARMALIATREFLEINIDELKRILADVELCMNDTAANSWAGEVDRQGGAFTDEAINWANEWR